MPTCSIFPIVLSVLSIATCGVLVHLLLKHRRNDCDDRAKERSSYISSLNTQIDLLTDRNDHMHDKLTKIALAAKTSKRTLDQIVGAHIDSPLPMWLKDINGTMLLVNDAYERMFLIPAGLTKEDYIGHNDYDVWDQKTANQFHIHDIGVLSQEVIFNESETFPVNGVMQTFRVIKYPYYVDGELFGTAGLAIPPADVPLKVSRHSKVKT